LKRNDTNQNFWTFTWYMRDAQGNMMATYTETHDALSAALMVQEFPMYGSSRLGVYNTADTISEIAYSSSTFDAAGFYTSTADPVQIPTPDTSRYHYVPLHKQYEMSNHLGNVLVTVSARPRLLYDQNDDFLYKDADVMSVSDYFPFGMMMPSRHWNSDSYKFGFNGMEADNELKGSGNSYDFGARIYDSRLGRWLAMDPLAMKYPSMSPYNFVGNSPILFVDPNGKEIWINPPDGGKPVLYVPNKTSISEKQCSFVQVVAETLDYLSSSGQDVNEIINILANDNSRVSISSAEWNARFSNVSGHIEWSPESGMVTVEGGRQSPSIGLLHELGHSYYQYYNPEGRHVPDPNEYGGNTVEWKKALDEFLKTEIEETEGYDGYEEKWVIENVENPAAKKANQAQRKDHQYKEKFKAKSPISTEGPTQSELE